MADPPEVEPSSPETHRVSTLPKVVSELPPPGTVTRPGRKQAREVTRGRIAVSLLVMLGGTIVAGWFAVAFHWAPTETIKDVLTITLGALVGLTGTAIGFYFGKKD